MKRLLAGDKPGLIRLKNDIEKNRKLVRKAAPITEESTGFTKLSGKMDKICLKLKGKKLL